MSRTPDANRPHALPANQVPVYYAGGDGIARFRGARTGDGPEDWVGSLSALPAAILPAGADPDSGISRLADGTLLRDAVAADPRGWLGDELAATFGDEPGLLVKLLDAGERLPVHCHPDRATASTYLGSRFGKTEGWIIMDAAPGAAIWLGFREGVQPDRMRKWIDGQDVDSMLAAMNRLEVHAGETYYLPAGTPHAIGPGVMLTELQEPTSFSIIADHSMFGLDAAQATLGLGWDRAIACFDLAACTGARLDALRPPPVAMADGSERIFPSVAARFFQAYRHRVRGTTLLGTPSFSVLIVVGGAGELRFAGGSVPVASGTTWVVPFAAGELTAVGALEILRCVPPVVAT